MTTKDIPFVLSDNMDPSFQAALKQVAELAQDGWTVTNVTREVQNGQGARGVIIVSHED